ncbi:MAG: peptidoglycan DD-metalloendopeptidase family protein, partial [Myxococcota bacterium]|nr:peptidoglycan DD-metalloendopeptidase family protein [Myxococcota bacterium]
YCERRSWTMPLCPTGMGHQGQDIRPSTCRAGVHPAVAVTDGTITHIGSYAVYLTAADGTRFDYLHMSGVRVEVGDRVRRGDVLGMVDDEFGGTPTTVHLHFNIRQTVAGVGNVYVPPYMSLVRAYEALLGGGGTVDPPPPTMPRLAAEYVHQSFPLASEPFVLPPGALRSGYLEMRNRGTETWRPGVTFLDTTEPRETPSPLAGPDWLSPSRAATVDREVPTGATGRFAFTIRAPDAPGDHPQYFGLRHDGVGWFGDDGGPPDRWIQIRVTVDPAAPRPPEEDGGSPPVSDAGTSSPGSDAGGAADAAERDADAPGSGGRAGRRSLAGGCGIGNARGARTPGRESPWLGLVLGAVALQWLVRRRPGLGIGQRRSCCSIGTRTRTRAPARARTLARPRLRSRRTRPGSE